MKKLIKLALALALELNGGESLSLPSLLTPICQANKALTIEEFNRSLDKLELALIAVEEDQKKRQIGALSFIRKRS